ncbi:MAG: xanthine dehydrogenase family protein [Chloroflexi bacterium]|nr:xanthine dehydrogenase family protein [Chloroflexota bacterium]
MVYLAVKRSPHVHATLDRIDLSAARSLPGVLAVADNRDFDGRLGPLPVDAGLSAYPDPRVPPRHPLAHGMVRYVGEPVAVVVADSRALARDAVDAIEVGYTPLPGVVDVERALEPAAPRVFEAFADNVASRVSRQSGDYARAARDADLIVTQRIVNQRVFPAPMEPRCSVAHYLAATDELTLWASTQIPHQLRTELARLLGMPTTGLRVVARDVGGGFGAKIEVGIEELLACHYARHLERPVNWCEERRENFVAMIHGRGQVDQVELAASADGTILGVKIRVLADLGAGYQYVTAVANYTIQMIPGVYACRNVDVELIEVFTNKTPAGAYRGAGRPEAALAVERAVDRLAARLGRDPVDVRRKNFIPPSAFPYRTPLGYVYDSGEYERALDRALELGDYPRLRGEQEAARAAGRYVGLGVAVASEICGDGPWESATVRVGIDGAVEVLTGTSPHGQGHVTTWAQLVADALQVPLASIVVRHSDTAVVPTGVGTFGSRSAAVGGSAVQVAAERVRARAQRVAAHQLEVAPDDVELVAGRYVLRGVPDRSLSLADVAAAAYAGRVPDTDEPGLEATHAFQIVGETFPFGAHLALVEVEPETGKVSLLKYVAVDDCGTVINPLIVDGQRHGGLAQGIGQALFEEVTYGDDGQLLTGTLAEYVLPRAGDLIDFTLDRTETPTPLNPLGAKGVGELSTISSPAAIMNAVVDALAPAGVTHVDMPATSEKLWRTLHR